MPRLILASRAALKTYLGGLEDATLLDALLVLASAAIEEHCGPLSGKIEALLAPYRKEDI